MVMADAGGFVRLQRYSGKLFRSESLPVQQRRSAVTGLMGDDLKKSNNLLFSYSFFSIFCLLFLCCKPDFLDRFVFDCQ